MNLVNSAGQKRSFKVYQLILGHLILLLDGNSESSDGYKIFDYAQSCKMSRIYPWKKLASSGKIFEILLLVELFFSETKSSFKDSNQL